MRIKTFVRFALIVGCASLGCSAGVGDPTGSSSSSTHPQDDPGSLPIDPLAPIVTCSSGLDLVGIAFSGVEATWDTTDFDTSLESDLGNPTDSPWYLTPRDASYSWFAYQLPDGYPSSIDDLVAQYANVDPVDARIAQCTSTSTLADGGVITSDPASYVIWDPRTGGTGGIDYQPTYDGNSNGTYYSSSSQ